MTDISERLLALAERVEATGPDRELDYAVARGTGWSTTGSKDWFPHWCSTNQRTQKEMIGVWLEHGPCPFFTASLDAAMTLAEGLERFGGAPGLLREAMDRLFRVADPAFGRGDQQAYREALARYFTAACLRARAALAKDPQP